MSLDAKELNSRLWAEWKNGMKIMAESLMKDSVDISSSGCTIVLGNENFIQRVVMYLQRKSYIGKFKDYKTCISAYEKTVMELIEQVNKMLAGTAPRDGEIGASEPTKIEYKSTLADIIIDGDDRLEIAARAEAELERCAGKRGEYGLFSNNCHAFTRYCITGERSTEGAFGEAEIEAALESVFKTQVVWIPMGRG